MVEVRFVKEPKLHIERVRRIEMKLPSGNKINFSEREARDLALALIRAADEASRLNYSQEQVGGCGGCKGITLRQSVNHNWPDHCLSCGRKYV
jgi:hypothetical protein